MDDREITLICTLKATITIPDNLKNENEVREYLNRYYYNENEILNRADIYDFEIEDIEDCPCDEEDIDVYIDDKLMGELE